MIGNILVLFGCKTLQTLAKIHCSDCGGTFVQPLFQNFKISTLGSLNIDTLELC